MKNKIVKGMRAAVKHARAKKQKPVRAWVLWDNAFCHIMGAALRKPVLFSSRAAARIYADDFHRETEDAGRYSAKRVTITLDP